MLEILTIMSDDDRDRPLIRNEDTLRRRAWIDLALAGVRSRLKPDELGEAPASPAARPPSRRSPPWTPAGRSSTWSATPTDRGPGPQHAPSGGLRRAKALRRPLPLEFPAGGPIKAGPGFKVSTPMSVAARETHGFQAEVQKLLHLMIHSLYSNREIFLRELISNASDAADRLRFEALANPALLEPDPELKVRVEYDAAAKTVSVIDNGIGMTREEVIRQLGTIARSGTGEFISQLSGEQKKDAQPHRPVRRRLLLGLHRGGPGGRRDPPGRRAGRRGRPLGVGRAGRVQRRDHRAGRSAAPGSPCTSARTPRNSPTSSACAR